MPPHELHHADNLQAHGLPVVLKVLWTHSTAAGCLSSCYSQLAGRYAPIALADTLISRCSCIALWPWGWLIRGAVPVDDIASVWQEVQWVCLLQAGLEGWQDVGGMQEVRAALREALELPTKYARLVAR